MQPANLSAPRVMRIALDRLEELETMDHFYHFTSEEGYAALIDNAATLYASGVPRGELGQPITRAGSRLDISPQPAPQVKFGTDVVGFISLLIAFPSPDGHVEFLQGITSGGLLRNTICAPRR